MNDDTFWPDDDNEDTLVDYIDGDPADDDHHSQWDDDPNPYCGTYSEE